MREKLKQTEHIQKPEQKETPKFFGAVLVLGNVPDFIVEKNQPRLSFDGKMRVVAAGELYRSGLTTKLILSGGRTLGPKHSSEAVIMAEYLTKRFKIPPGAIVLEEESTDTIENVENLKKIVEKEKISGPLAILSNSYHISRILKIMEQKGLTAEPITAENTLLARSEHYRPLVEKYLSSGMMKLKKVKEAMLRGLLIIDPKGTLPRQVTRRLRS